MEKVNLVIPMSEKPHVRSPFRGRVRSISIEGYGVVDHPDGFVFFVLGCFPGDVGHFEVLSLKKRYGFARLVELTEKMPERVDPPCPHNGLRPGECSGCPWMSLPYEKQMDLKHHILDYNLKREHIVEPAFIVPPIVPSPSVFGYRNRAQFKSDGSALGYVSRFYHQLAPIKDCLVLNPSLRELLHKAILQLPFRDWKPDTHYPWVYLDVDDETTVESIIPNQRRPFKQANPETNEIMKAWVRKFTQHWAGGNVLELFCGSGNFTAVLTENSPADLIAVDVASIGLNQIKSFSAPTPLRVIEANLFKPSDWKNLKEFQNQIDYVFLDPPRDGFKKLDMFLSQWGFPKEVVYISCHLESFLHDVGRLKKKGYKLVEVQGVDQFPHTSHIEVLSVLRRES